MATSVGSPERKEGDEWTMVNRVSEVSASCPRTGLLCWGYTCVFLPQSEILQQQTAAVIYNLQPINGSCFLGSTAPPTSPLNSALDATHVRLDPLSLGSWAGDGTPSFGTPSPFLIHPLLGRALKQDRSLGSAERSAHKLKSNRSSLSPTRTSFVACCRPNEQSNSNREN